MVIASPLVCWCCLHSIPKPPDNPAKALGTMRFYSVSTTKFLPTPGRKLQWDWLNSKTLLWAIEKITLSSRLAESWFQALSLCHQNIDIRTAFTIGRNQSIRVKHSMKRHLNPNPNPSAYECRTSWRIAYGPPGDILDLPPYLQPWNNRHPTR